MAARGFLGAGDLYIARYNGALGAFEAFKGPYEATKFEIKPNVEIRELSSRGRNTYGQVIESVPLAQPSDFTVEMPEVNKESLAIALLGTTSSINVAAGTFTDVEVTVRVDGFTPVGTVQNIAGEGLTVTSQDGATTYALGTDYEVNYRFGWLRALPGGAIEPGEVVRVSGTNNAVSGTLISGGTNAQIRAKFLLDGKNFADDLPCIVEVHEGVIAADAAFDFLSDDFASVSMPGRMKTPVGYSEPFTVKLLDTAA